MNEKGEKTEWNQLVQRESARLEWKENVANPLNVVKTLSAFANDFQQVGGGRVICGLKEEKDENGEPVAKVTGLDEKRFKEIRNKVLDYCHRYVDPPITPVVSDFPVPGYPSRRILSFAITSSSFAHRYKTKNSDVNYYIRVNDQTRAANGLIPQLLEQKQIWPPYLDQTLPETTIDTIDLMAVKEFLGKLDLPHPVAKYLEPNIRFRGDILDLVTHPPGGSQKTVPRNFTILLFGQEPHLFFRGAYAIFSIYQGNDRASARSQRFELFGPLPVLIRSLMTRLQIYMGMDIDTSEEVLKGGNPNRRRFSTYAVQEAIVNAFVHRDYHSHEPVRVTLFDDRIEVTNPGGPNVPMDEEQIREGKVFTSWRNPSLAWFMVELKFAQNEGKGIQAIIRHTKKIAGKEPHFTITNHWFNVEIPAAIPLLNGFREKNGGENETRNESKSIIKITPQASKKGMKTILSSEAAKRGIPTRHFTGQILEKALQSKPEYNKPLNVPLPQGGEKINVVLPTWVKDEMKLWAKEKNRFLGKHCAFLLEKWIEKNASGGGHPAAQESS